MSTLRFRFTFVFLFILLAYSSAVLAQPIPAWYKNNARIHSYLLNLQTRFPNNIRVDSIGHSYQDSLPIWMARISNNASIMQDKPRVILVGQVHAEEVLGVELCLRLAAEICSTYSNITPARYVDWRSQLEIYIIPTLNPEGLNVVTETDTTQPIIHPQDETFRKNKHWVWNETRHTQPWFHYQRGIGQDSDGVDLNRNFPLNWNRGDTLLQPGRLEVYDYFRGLFPGSESETRAFMNVMYTLRPMYGVIYHSSRQGGVAENIYFPWDWEATGAAVVTPGRRCPDFALHNQVGAEMSALMQMVAGGAYPWSGYRTRNGEAGDWAYYATGCDLMHIEIGPQIRNMIQPDSATARRWFDLMIRGNYVLLNRCLNTNPTGSSLTGFITDSATGQRLPGAEVRVRELYNRILEPRLTDAFGRYNHGVMAGVYSLQFRKYGYRTKDTTRIIVGDAQRRPLNVALAPLPRYNVMFRVSDNNNTGIPSRIVLFHPDRTNDTLVTNGDGYASEILAADTFIVSVNVPNYVARVDTLIPTYNNYSVNIRLIPVGTRVQEGFEGGFGGWTNSDGIWGIDGQAHSGTFGMSQVPGGNWFFPADSLAIHLYEPHSNTWAMWNRAINLRDSVRDASLTYWIRGELEPEHDTSWVDISIDNGANWRPLPGTTKWQTHFEWTQVNASLRPYLGNPNVKFRWHFVSDSLIDQQGIHVDDVEVRLSNQLDTPDVVAVPNEYKLGTPYPNPFNATLRIPYSVRVPGAVSFRIFDVTGRTLTELHTSVATAGKHDYVWDASRSVHGEPASGLYFVEMKSGNFKAMRKVMLLK